MKPIIIIERTTREDFETACEKEYNNGYKIIFSTIKEFFFHIKGTGEEYSEVKYIALMEHSLVQNPTADTRAAKYKMDLQQIYNKISTLDREMLSYLDPVTVNERNEALCEVLEEIEEIIAKAIDRH